MTNVTRNSSTSAAERTTEKNKVPFPYSCIRVPCRLLSYSCHSDSRKRGGNTGFVDCLRIQTGTYRQPLFLSREDDASTTPPKAVVQRSSSTISTIRFAVALCRFMLFLPSRSSRSIHVNSRDKSASMNIIRRLWRVVCVACVNLRQDVSSSLDAALPCCDSDWQMCFGMVFRIYECDVSVRVRRLGLEGD